MDRAKMAKEYHDQGYSCAQAVACAFYDVIGMDVEQVAALMGCFGGGFRVEETCGVISGAAMVLGARYPHREPMDNVAKQIAAKKMKDFNARFLARFPSLRCCELKPLPAAPEKSPAAQRLGIDKTCKVYIVAAAEILEEMLAEG